jgi:hypothetical protein
MTSLIRYDRFVRRRARPPLPPLVLCAPADPASWSTRFLDDVALMAGAAAIGRPLPPFVRPASMHVLTTASRLPTGAAAIGRPLPPFVPLGGAPRSGERLVLCDASMHVLTTAPRLPTGERLVLCDASGAPLRLSEPSGLPCPRRRPALLPIGPLWRAAFGGNAHDGAQHGAHDGATGLGGSRATDAVSGGGSPPPLPLWLCYTPGACFGAVSGVGSLPPPCMPRQHACAHSGARPPHRCVFRRAA